MKSKKILKSLTSLFLSTVILFSTVSSGLTTAFGESDNGISVSKTGIVGGNITSSRFDGNTFNIINDGDANNTTVGLWSYDISDRENITSAHTTATVTKFYKQNIDGLSVDFYYVNPSTVETYLKEATSTDKVTNITEFASNAGDSSISYIKTTFGLSEKNLIGSLSHSYSSDSNTEFTLDLTTAYHDMTNGSWSGLCIIAMCNKNNGATASNPIWSDSWIKLGNITYSKASNTLDLTQSAILTGGSGNARYNGNVFNIVNDGSSTCTTVGLWNYTFDSFKYIDSASVHAFVNNFYKATIDDLDIDFYYINPSLATAYLKELSQTDKTATDSDFTSNMGDSSVSWIKNKFSLSDSNKVGSLSHNYVSSLSRYTTLNLATALNTAKQNSWNGICIVAMCSKNNNGVTSNQWSDSWIELDSVSYSESQSYIPIDKTGILCGVDSTTRYNGNLFNIVNDSLANNTTVGLWSYDITDIGFDDNSSVSVTTSSWSQEKIENFGIEFYCIDTTKVEAYLKSSSETKKSTLHSGIASNAGSSSVAYIKETFGLSDDNTIGYIAHDYTEESNKYVTLDITSAVKKAKENGIENITVIAMCSKNNDGNTSAKWSDAWIELSGINYGADLTLAEIQPLKNAMAEFETKMASGKIYKNMGTAYTAYVNAQKAIDAYAYGGVSSISILQYTTALKNATALMTEWSAPSPNISPKFSSTDSGTISLKTGCLWYEYSSDPLVKTFVAEGNNTTTNLYYQNSVYLYTDTTPNIPYLVGFYKTSSSSTANPQNPRVFYVSLSEKNGGLYIKNAQYQGDIASREFTTVMSKSYQINSSETGNSNNIILSTGDMRYMANFFNIDYQTAFQSSYYVEAKPTKFKIGIGYKDAGNSVQWVKEITGVDSKTFYVINYKPLLEKITSSANKAMLKNIQYYKQGGLSALMQAYDTATAVDPTSYDYSLSTATKVTNCATEIQNAVNKFNSATSFTRDTNLYDELRNTLASAKKIGNKNKVISSESAKSTRYTSDSWNTYYTALIQAQNAMADVISANGYTGTYNSKSTTAIAQELATAMNGLKYNYIVEFISAANQDMGSVVIEDGETVDTSSIVNTSVVKGVQERQAHIVYYWTPITVNKSEYGDTEVITINEQNKEQACEVTLGDITKEATCDSPGIREGICDICGGVYQYETDKTEHNYTSEVIPSTCAEKGYTLYTCTHCGDSYKDNYTELAEHTYETVTVAPTCTEKGYTAQRCTVCGNEIIDESSYVDALKHEYKYSVIREADCTFKGVGEYACIRGDESYTELLPENPDNHPNLIYSRTVSPTATESGYDIYYCDNLCGYWEKKNITAPTGTTSEFNDCLEAYNASLLTITENFEAYTDESKANYTEAIESAKNAAVLAIEAKDCTALDSATKSIIEASAVLRVKTISIKLLVYSANGEIIEPTDSTTQAQYGDIVTLDISNEIDNLNVEKWTVKKDGVTKKISQNEAVCQITANSDAVVTAYLTDEEVETSNKTKLTLLNNDDRVLETTYVSSTNALDLTKATVAGVTAPSIPFYVFKEWTIVKSENNELIIQAAYEVI